MDTSHVIKESTPEMSSLEWIELQDAIDAQSSRETFLQRAVRKTIANPIAPIGLIAACGFLIYGLKALKRGDSRQQQFMMRGRVISQAIGVGSIMVALMMARKKEE